MIHILKDKKENAEFMEHLANEFSVENILFYNRVQFFKTNFHNMNVKERDSFVHSIYRRYVAPGSDYQINIGARMLKNIEDTLNTGDESIYDEALQEIINLMAINSLPRYEKIRNVK